MAELEEFDHPVGGAAEARVARTDETREHRALVLLPGKNEIFAHREPRKDLQQLEGAADAEPVEVARAHAGDGPSVEPHLALARRQLAEDAVEQGRLAAAVGADDAEDLALAHLEGNAVDRSDAAEALLDVGDFEHRRPSHDPSIEAPSDARAAEAVQRAAVGRW